MNAIAQSAPHRNVLRELADSPKPMRAFAAYGQTDIVQDLLRLGYVRQLELGRAPVEKLLAIAPSGRELLATAS